MEALGKFFAGIVMIILGLLLESFVLFKLWAWFITPVFTTMPSLNFGQAMGLGVFLGIIFMKKSQAAKDFAELFEQWLNAMITVVLLFGFAWIIFLFIR